MKRIALLITLSICFATSQAQDISDGLRYSSNQNLGTARYTALSGSMGALGGDFSAISSNPASGAVFLTSTLSLSSAFNNINNSSNYFNNEEEASKTDFSLNQLGAIFVINNAN